MAGERPPARPGEGLVRWVSGPGLDAREVLALTPGLIFPTPTLMPQELAEARAGLQAQEKELCRAQGRQEELLQKLQEAQEREAATAIQNQALTSQLEEAQAARREVSDGGGWGQQ